MTSRSSRSPFKWPFNGANLQGSLVVAVVVALLLSITAIAQGPASAASQNELLIGIDFDGQSFTGDDPLDPGTGITAAHTAGDDERDDNGVVRTFDLVGYRVDYNVNEEGQTGAQIQLQLPANMTFITAAATVTPANPQGMFPGCQAGSTITSSGTVAPYGVVGTNDILTCVVDTEDEQGNNGTIYPIAQLLKDIDGQTKTLAGSLDTNEQPCGLAAICSGSVDVISSGAPTANFKKGKDVKDQDQNVIGREPNEFYPFEKDGVDGWISIYEIEFRTAGNSILGSEPIDDTYPINFYDHFWDATPGTILATSDGTIAGTSLIPGRTACGEYDGGGALPTGAATWTCTVASPTSIEFDLTGYDTDAFVPNADLSPNTSVYAAAQVAFWSPQNELLAKDPMQNVNTISQSATAPSGVNVADPILFGGTAGPVAESTVLDNDASELYALTISSPGPRALNSWTRFMNGPFAAREYVNTLGDTVMSVDERDSSVGGIGGYNEINTCTSNGTTFTINSQREGWCGRQETPRGKVLTINAAVSGRLTGETSQFDPIHSCIAIDNTHMSLIALPDDIDVSIVEGVDPRDGTLKPNSNGRIRAVSSDEATTIGGYTVNPNQGPLAHTFSGLRSNLQYHWSADGWSVTNDIPASSIVVEFASSANPFTQTDTPTAVTSPVTIGQHELTCNNDDAASGWVSSTGDLSAFDGDGDGLYEGIDLVRVRMIDSYDWLITGDVTGGGSIGMEVNLQAQVHQDPAVDAAGQEIFVFSSRSYGDWDVTTQNQPPAADCLSTESSFGSAADRLTPDGWCGLPYTEDTNLSPNAAGGALFLDTNAIEYVNSSGSRGASHADKIFIVEADIAVKKTNLAGLTDIKDNGEIVTYGINVSTVGASTDLLSDVTLTDNLPASLAFVGFTQLPTTPGATCTPGDPFVCDFGDQVGGWSDYVEVEVMVQGTEADTKVTNTAKLTADRSGIALSKSSSAFSRTPGAFDEAAIIKAVNTIEGDCVAYPEGPIDVPLDAEPADWADRCEMTDFDTGQLLFDLELSNEGNLTQTGVRFVDVFPHTADEAEAASATGVVGDGRAPESDFEGDVAFVSFTGPDVVDVWVTGDDPTGVSRDPENAITDTTWCDAASGTVQNPGNTGSGVCPIDNAAVTAIYAEMADVGVAETVSGTLELVNDGHECDDIWTNSFGARHDRTLLPIRSNDVSIMVNCEFDLALEKQIDPAFTPGADWLTEGTTTVDFLMEVTNQGDPIEDFHVTDYVDTAVFTFDVANNADGTTTGDQALPFIWDAADPAAPVAQVDGALVNGESVFIPVTLIVETSDGTLENWAEISYFDSDGDPSNGDSDPANPNNPDTGELTDVDSTPDADQSGDAQPDAAGAPGDGEVDGNGDGTDPVTGDEDDHDVAGIPTYDLELIKTPGAPTFDFLTTPPTVTYDLTVTNQGPTDVFWVDVTDYGATGLTYDPAATAAAWTAAGLTGVTDANPTFTIEGPIAASASVVIPVVYAMDLSQAPFTNAAEISAFDSDADNTNAVSPFAVDIDSTPDATNDDDVIDHDRLNNDPDGDGNFNEATPGDEDDHDIETLAPYDLALVKTFDSAVTPLFPDGSVTMLIEVANQASAIATLDVTDYVDATMWQPFDPALNPSAPVHADSTAALPFSFSWDATDPLNPVAIVIGDTSGDLLAFGETVVIPITLKPVEGFAAVSPLSNTAEISNFDNDEDPTNGNAFDGTLVDVDSTPDADNGNGPGEDADMVDDETGENGTAGGDEDDHDGVLIPVYDLELIKTPGAPTFDFTTSPPTVAYDLTVTNQGPTDVFWVDVTDYGAAGLTYDPAATAAAWTAAGLTGVTDANPTFTIEGPIAASTSVTIPVVYQITDFSEAPFTNAAEISAFDSDADNTNAADPLAFDVDSTPDATNDDDVIDHDQLNNDPDGDGNFNEATPGDEDDHDIETLAPYDLALAKTFDSMVTPLLPDGNVTMLIEVTNQAAPIATLDITDYIDATMWEAFNPALNADGAVHADSTAVLPFSFAWDATDPLNPVATITADTSGDMIGFGETIVIPITLEPVDGFAAVSPLSNTAEISNFDNDEDPTNGDAADGTLEDLDSTPDADNGNGPGEDPDADMADDAIDGDGTAGGDEDDHDGVLIPVYDLELIKTAATPTFDFTTSPPTVTYELTVTNQGPTEVYWTDVTDYGAAGLTYDDAATAAAFTAAGISGVIEAAPVFTVRGPLAGGDSVTFPVVYQITDFSEAPFTNSAEISKFDTDDDPVNPADPFAIDVDSNPDNVDDDDVEDHNIQNNDPDGDGNFNEATPGDEDDHDIETVAPYDLALAKTFDSMVTPLVPDGNVTMLIEVTNQAAPIATLDITDYIDATMWEAFSPVLNPDGAVHANSTAALPFSFAWDATDPLNPVATITADTSGDMIGFGETIVIPVTLEPLPNFQDAEPLANTAEISNFDNDEDPTNGDAADGTLEDLDSTPDADNGNGPGEDPDADMADDAIDGDGTAGGDEDDHDGVLIPLYDLELIKTAGSPTLDFSTSPATVTYDLTITNQGYVDVYWVDIADYGAAGLTYNATATATAWTAAGLVGVTDANPTFTIEGPIVPGVTVSIPVVYDITDIYEAPFTNSAEISAFDNDADNTNAPDPSAIDVDSNPDGVDDDEVIDHNETNYDPDGNGDVNEATPGDEDDHDIETVYPYDLALAKTFEAMDTPLLPDGTVTMLIEVTNQLAPVATVDITDYVDAAVWQPFDAALNADGPVHANSTAALPFSFAWDATDPLNPVATVTADTSGDTIGFGETIVIPITLQPAIGFDTSQPLVNTAEISNFDNDEDPANGDAADGKLSDADSTPDAENGNGPGEDPNADMVDDAIDGDGNPGNDEDDHDGVTIPVMDLALRKTLDASTVFPITPGGLVTFSIEVINQGSTHASGISLVDFVDPAMWEALDVALNPADTDYTWATNANGQDGDVTITSILAPGETIIVPVTLTIAAGADLEALSNTAEIATSTATDETGVEVTNPDGSPVVDIDSTPDGVNDDPLVDDTLDGTGGDEDDHDIALVTPPTYSLGNQIWDDADNNGTLDDDEEPIEGVIVQLFSDADGDGAPDDLNGDGIIDENDAIATDTTGPDGDYLFTDLPVGDYIVGIAPQNWDEGGALEGWLSSDPTSTDPNDDVDNNDDGTPDLTSGYVFSGPVTLDDGEPTGEEGLSNDPNTPDPLSNLTVDFGFWQPVFDLALKKTLAANQSTSVNIGDDVTFTIEVINQGDTDATDVEVIDYLPTGMTLNDSDWTDNGDGTATTTIPGTIAAGASTTIDVTVKVTSAGSLDNNAEISSATATQNGEALVTPNGEPINDVDSNADDTNLDAIGDDITDGTGGDEDDHDIATISVTAPASPSAPLAFSGSTTLPIVLLALFSILLGTAMVLGVRRRNDY